MTPPKIQGSLSDKETDALNKHGAFLKKRVLHELQSIPGLRIVSEELGVSFGPVRVIDIVALDSEPRPAFLYGFECKRAFTTEKRWFSILRSPFSIARIQYAAGYVLPGATPGAGQTALPDDLEQAAVEQVAYWFRNRDNTGTVRTWPHDGTYQAFLQSDLLLEVRAVLRKYKRLAL